MKILSHDVHSQYAGMRFSMSFSCENFLPWNFLEFNGNGIGMPI